MQSENENKQRVVIWMNPDTAKKCERYSEQNGYKNVSQFISRGMDFYTGYLEMPNHTDFMAKVVSEAVEGAIGSTENRLARLMFKEAVELAKLTQMLAYINEMDDDTLDRLHYKCVQEVKKINGVIKFEDTVRNRGSDE